MRPSWGGVIRIFLAPFAEQEEQTEPETSKKEIVRCDRRSFKSAMKSIFSLVWRER